jgi:GAF domain-containing protein
MSQDCKSLPRADARVGTRPQNATVDPAHDDPPAPRTVPEPGGAPGYTPAPIPADDAERLEALRATGLLDSPPAEAFDRITRSLSALVDVPTALISLVDRERQWFLSRQGLAATQTPREVSFCGHAVAQRATLEVVDALQDARFAGNPLVAGEPHIRAYLGVPLFDDAGHALGTLCVIDYAPRSFSAEQRQIVQRYARAVEHLLRRR